jgi:hypothetical protein
MVTAVERNVDAGLRIGLLIGQPSTLPSTLEAKPLVHFNAFRNKAPPPLALIGENADEP